MTTFAPKTYQQQVLDSVEGCFKACHELPSPSIAFTATTERLWGRGNAYNQRDRRGHRRGKGDGENRR
jgi:type III restriction enzyme